jgi:hypothetical protein
VDTPLPEQSAQRLSDQTADHSLSSPTNVVALSADSSLRQFEQTPSTPAAPTRARLTFSPVSAGSPTGNRRGPVILRLINGPTIQADEAWEKREGIWYRQGGVVTFLKRGRVKTIEQSLRSTPKSATHNMEERNRTSGSQVPQNQLRIRRLEAAETKKPSRITSFLKSAGRAFKKPFKF